MSDREDAVLYYSFLEVYKRLDNLIRDCYQSENGVSTYISQMEKLGLKSDQSYHMLKRLRVKRNQLAHDSNVYLDEDTQDEIVWLEAFCQRIFEQSDPLTEYRKASEAKKKNVYSPPKKVLDTSPTEPLQDIEEESDEQTRFGEWVSNAWEDVKQIGKRAYSSVKKFVDRIKNKRS